MVIIATQPQGGEGTAKNLYIDKAQFVDLRSQKYAVYYGHVRSVKVSRGWYIALFSRAADSTQIAIIGNQSNNEWYDMNDIPQGYFPDNVACFVVGTLDQFDWDSKWANLVYKNGIEFE